MRQAGQSDTQCREVLDLVAQRFFSGCVATAENVICEALREANDCSDNNAWDTLVKDFRLVKIVEGKVYFYDYDGQAHLHEWIDWNHNNNYNPDTPWWGDNFVSHRGDEEVIYQLTTNNE